MTKEKSTQEEIDEDVEENKELYEALTDGIEDIKKGNTATAEELEEVLENDE